MEKQDKLFNRITENALGFLRDAIELINSDLKKSLISFAIAVELFLKARLMHEHWTLILENPDNTTVSEFEKGDFISVNVQSAILRLQKVLGLSISTSAEKAFKNIRTHRNKMIHFYHPEYADAKNPKATEVVMKDQYVGWVHLHELLSEEWEKEFINHQESIKDIDRLMKGHRDFIDARYETLKDSISDEIAKGMKFGVCAVCQKLSSRMSDLSLPVYTGVCRVCGDWDVFVEAICSSCSYIGYYDWSSSDRDCSSCTKDVQIEIPDDAMEVLISHYGDDPFMNDGIDYNGHCPECEHSLTTAIPAGDGGAFCLNCATEYDEMGQCEHCGTYIAGFTEVASSYLGCFICSASFPDANEKY